MIGLVMAGGRGSRMATAAEKLTLGHRRPVVLGAVGALSGCGAILEVAAAVSPHAPQTRSILEGRARLLETPGSGYSADLACALDMLEGPVLVVPGDLPLLDSDMVCRVAGMYDAAKWVTLLVSEEYAGSLGSSPGISVRCDGQSCRYTGISVVDARSAGAVPQRNVIVNDPRIAINTNTIQDWRVLLGGAHDSPEYLCL